MKFKSILTLLVSSFLLAACEKGPLTCTSDKTKDLVIEQAKKSLLKQVENIKPTDMYWVQEDVINMLNQFDFSVVNVKTTEKNEGLNIYACDATLVGKMTKKDYLNLPSVDLTNNREIEMHKRQYQRLDGQWRFKLNYTLEPVDDGKNTEVNVLVDVQDIDDANR